MGAYPGSKFHAFVYYSGPLKCGTWQEWVVSWDTVICVLPTMEPGVITSTSTHHRHLALILLWSLLYATGLHAEVLYGTG